MKLFAKSLNGKMLKLGNISEEAKWYFMTDAIMKDPATVALVVGDVITIESKPENGSDYITKITKGDITFVAPAVTPKAVPQNTGAVPNKVVTQKNGYLPKEEWIEQQKKLGLWKESPSGTDRGADVNSSIKRQAIGNMTSRTLIGMQHLLTEDNVEQVIERVYKKYVELVG